MSFRGSGVLGLMNFTCYGWDPVVSFRGNNFRFRFKKCHLQKYHGISVFERKFVELGSVCFCTLTTYEDGYITVFMQHRSESVFIC
jgi:hypothetical protein